MNPENQFETAGREKQPGLVAELAGMLRNNKKFWLIPLLLALLVIGLLIILGGTAASPFIYPFF